MERAVSRGRLLVAPRNCGVRRHKALAPWRFQPGYVRRQVKGAGLDGSCSACGGGGGGGCGFQDSEGVSDAGLCVAFGGSESGSDAKDCGCSGLGSDCNPEMRDCMSEEGSMNGTKEAVDGSFLGSEGNAARQDCQLERCGSNDAVEACDSPSESGGGAKDSKLEGSESSGPTRDCKLENFKSSGDEKDCNLEGVKSVGTSVDGKTCCAGKVGGIDGFERNGSAGDCQSEGLETNGSAGDCISDGLKNNCTFQISGATKDNNVEGHNSNEASKDCNFGGLRSNDAKANNGEPKDDNLKELGSNAAAKDCKFVGSQSGGNAQICRKGRKALAPWRFQLRYKRSFSKAFDLGDWSAGPCGTLKSGISGSPSQHTPATGSSGKQYARSHRTGARVPATCDFSSEKDKEETDVASKKRRIEKECHEVKPKDAAEVTRESIMESLLAFQRFYSKSRQTDHAQQNDLAAFKVFREQFDKAIYERKYVGNVPGIEIGDVFHLRVELCIAGLHRHPRSGIDFITEKDGTSTAVSIVSYANSSDIKNNNLDLFVYCGSKVYDANIAMKRSMNTNTPVRVIHGFVFTKTVKSRTRKVATFIYGGLYLVEKCWKEKGSENHYMFRLRRIVGQLHIDIEETLKSRKEESAFGIVMEDISQGQEEVPISVVNFLSDECPMPFQYISQLKYPPQHHPAPSAGCDCVGGCSDSEKCACAIKNGGEIPFNDKGSIVEAKPLVYECGPSCKCPPTCHNRVSQHGIKFRLQVFKTKSMGWGVRSLDSIPSGSFVCEYIGELLEDEEAQKRTNDEYLFAIGNNYYDETLWEGLSRAIPSLQNGPGDDDDGGFAVDASKCGNFARFINHNCTPNLYAQNVLYDHDNKSIPHIMFFASEDIPALQELSYHYNYTIDQVYDSDGNIKKKKCLCGSGECTGWLY